MLHGPTRSNLDVCISAGLGSPQPSAQTSCGLVSLVSGHLVTVCISPGLGSPRPRPTVAKTSCSLVSPLSGHLVTVCSSPGLGLRHPDQPWWSGFTGVEYIFISVRTSRQLF